VAPVAVDSTAPGSAPPSTTPAPEPEPSTLAAQTDTSAAVVPPPDVTPPAPDPAQLRRERRAYDAALTTANQAKARAVKAGASAAELRPADNLRRQADQLLSAGTPAQAMRQINDAAAAYGVAENNARLRTAQQQAAIDPGRLHPPAPQESTVQQEPIRQPQNDPPATAPAPAPAATTAAPVPAPVTAPVDERPAVELVLRNYARALSASDLPGMQAVFPGMGGQVRTAWQDFFKEKFSLDTSRWKIFDIDVAGTSATAKIGGVSIQRDKKGKEREVPPPKTAVLDKVGSSWRITSIN
jgi:hypothetical protein